MASDQQEAWLIMPGKAGSNVMTGVNSLPNDETDAAELRKAQSFGSSGCFGVGIDSGRDLAYSKQKTASAGQSGCFGDPDVRSGPLCLYGEQLHNFGGKGRTSRAPIAGAERAAKSGRASRSAGGSTARRRDAIELAWSSLRITNDSALGARRLRGRTACLFRFGLGISLRYGPPRLG